MPSVNDFKELLPRLESVDKDVGPDLKEICNCCNGRRVVPSEKVLLRKPCSRCGGEGKLYWVDKAMPKECVDINRDVLRDCVQQNITFLIQVIQQQAGLLGCSAKVDITPMEYDYYGPGSHIHSMNPPLYKVRDLDAESYIKKMGGF